jgi:hypothetical protein
MKIVGGELQRLSAVPAYSYTLVGVGQALTFNKFRFLQQRAERKSRIQSQVFATSATVRPNCRGAGYAGTATTRTVAFTMQKERRLCRDYGLRRIGYYRDDHY